MKHDFVVIGGGASGIAAARRLHEARADVLLVEASGRLGGRAHSVRVRGEVLDLGCAWLHSADRNPWTRIALAEGFQIDRTPAGWRTQWHDLGFPKDERAAFEEDYVKWHDRAEGFVHGPDRPLSDFIPADSPWRPLIDAISGYANGANLGDVSLHDWAAYENTAGDDNWRLQEGYGSLIAAHAKRLPVKLDTPVSLIDHRGALIRLTTPGGVIEADRIIVAVPTPIIADGDLAFDPPLDAKRHAAAALPLGLADKIFLGIRDGDYPHNAHLIGNPHSSNTASYQVGWLGRPLVEAFFGGDCAEALERQDDRAAADFAIGELAGLLGNDWRLRLQPLARTRWRAEKFIRGSYSHAKIGQAAQRGILAQPHDDRLFFAGEACHASDFSTAHGAYETGIAAAEEALAAQRRPRVVATIPLTAAPVPSTPEPPTEPMPAKPAKPRRSWPRRIFGWVWKGTLAFIVLSVVWVGLYRFIDPPVTLTMLGDGISGNGIVKRWMSLDEMDPRMARAAIAGEDSRFCLHNGFDFRAIEQAYSRNQKGGRIRGGSTISQQTAKNVFLIQSGGYVRKAFEAYFTFLIEHLWGKRRIMEVYLNVAETGIGTYGANAGSIRYFGHDASRMTAVEAGRIAAVLPLPKKRDAVDPTGFVRRHGNVIARYVDIVRADGLDGCLK
ncbi:MAG: FAD-dependent oxidoreductase [Sphingomonas bacterium]|nr:FAD-dependent oxidoreductase [Sphingomonas bacterium]